MLKFKSGNGLVGIKDLYVKDGNKATQISEAYQVRKQNGVSSLETLYEYICKHGYEAIEWVDPTCTDPGYAIYKCSKCGDTYEEVFEATGHGELSYTPCSHIEGDGRYGKHMTYCSVCDQSWEESCTEGDFGYCIYCGETVA